MPRWVALLACGLLLTGGVGLTELSNPTLVGKQAADFSLADLSGQQVSLQQFRGKPVLLSFWGYG